MKFMNLIAAFALVFFISCGGSGEQQQGQQQEADQSEEQTMAGEDVRTIEIIGIDNMQFVVEEETEGITAGQPVGQDSLLRLESITVQPGQEIHIQLTTRSELPETAMAHNWVLLQQAADIQEFANAAVKAKDNDYIPADKTDQVIAQTGLAGGGETTEVTFTAPEEPGEYEFLCTFPGHFAAGMRGTLIVEEAGTGGSS